MHYVDSLKNETLLIRSNRVPKGHILQGPLGPYPQLIDFDCLSNKDFKKAVEHFNSRGK